GSGATSMRVCVVGLWHLGAVTAACLASGGHEVIGFDFEDEVVERLRKGEPPLFEPGLEELVNKGLSAENLSFSSNESLAVSGADVVWVTYDTPVDDHDAADVEFVISRVKRLFPHLRPGTLMLISSQVPVGTTQLLEEAYS